MFPEKPKNKKMVYLDNAATTPMDSVVFSAMSKYLKKEYGNPSTLYSIGVMAKEKMENARKQVANVLFTQPDAIIFTGGGTESINLALLGFARKHKRKRQTYYYHQSGTSCGFAYFTTIGKRRL